MNAKRRGAISGTVVLMIVVLAVATAAVAVVLLDPWGENVVPQRFTPTPETHVQFKQVNTAILEMEEPRAIAVGPNDVIYVAGDKKIEILDPQGRAMKEHERELSGAPTCLAVAGDDHAYRDRIYVGMKDHVEVYKTNGEHVAAWDSLGEDAVLTSIAVAPDDVFVADHGNQIVYRYKPDGTLHSRIGARDDERNIPGLVIPSPYCDVAVWEGLLRVANTGKLRIETYSFAGELDPKRTWGKPADTEDDLEGFTGCCNPANFAILPDGRYVTVEKGVPRIKTWSREGEFLYLVAGPESLPPKTCDVATDSQGRVLVLDPRKAVRFFVEVETEAK